MDIFKRKEKIVVPVITEESKNVKVRCNNCGHLIDYNELKDNLKICPYCEYHFRMSASERISLLTDNGTFKKIGKPIQSVDTLNFIDTVPYKDRLKKLKKTIGLPNAIITGKARIQSMDSTIGVFAFEFLSGTLGSATGEKFTELVEFAGKNKFPLVVVFSSGGERIQEGIHSLFQVAKVIQAIEGYKKNGGLFISVLTNPVLGGVASIATGANIIIAEKNSYIGLSGPRVTKQVMKRSLPKQSQKAEALLKNGFIDRVVDRKDLKETIGFILKFYNRWKI
ncbi:MAG: acetyl-CoA carboxylase carboxyl transferase subunit beta [Nitrospiraceae bacterium]|nr:acetyl-CoA carboxylase carboxyl transferase subunit beta [Nitrospiraceae bacterium]